MLMYVQEKLIFNSVTVARPQRVPALERALRECSEQQLPTSGTGTPQPLVLPLQALGLEGLIHPSSSLCTHTQYGESRHLYSRLQQKLTPSVPLIPKKTNGSENGISAFPGRGISTHIHLDRGQNAKL